MFADVSDRPIQLLLSFPLHPACGRDDFLVGPCNRSAFELVERWPDWPGPHQLLVGPPGSGKSHLVAIWAAMSDAHVERDRFMASEILDAFEQDRPVAIELGDAAGIDEQALFHVLNAARQRQSGLLLTAQRSPREWPIALADLGSRLRAITPTTLGPPDETLLKQVMVKLFADRQAQVDMAVLDYALVRLERSFEAADMFVGSCDEIGLRAARRITKAVAAEALAVVENRLAERRALAAGHSGAVTYRLHR